LTEARHDVLKNVHVTRTLHYRYLFQETSAKDYSFAAYLPLKDPLSTSALCIFDTLVNNPTKARVSKE